MACGHTHTHTQTHKRRTLHRGLLWFMGAWSVHKTRASRLLKALAAAAAAAEEHEPEPVQVAVPRHTLQNREDRER